MHDPLNPYKLIVLFMLSHAEFPLTRIQIFDFVLGKGYTTYFALQKSIAELIDASLVKEEAGQNGTLLYLTQQGRTTLSYFENRVNDDIKHDIIDFLSENEIEMRNSMSVRADYCKAELDGYAVRLSITDTKEKPIEIELTAPTEDAARSICGNWKKSNQKIYAYIMKELL